MERSAIQLLHKRGKSQRQIAKDLGYSRVTVARVLKEQVEIQPARRHRTSIVDPYREQIVRWVGEGLTAVRMLELARSDPERPYPGSHSVFRAAVRQERLKQQQAQVIAAVPVRFEGLPGEYLQVDWGEVPRFPFTRQAPATRYFLACRLKYSRWSWVAFRSDMRQETLLRGLVDCFVTLGWVPWVLTFDNMKVVTSGRDTEGQPIWTPALVQLAQEFGFHPEACTPGAANQKGSVEALVKWVKGNFLPGRAFADDADLTQQQVAWLDDVNQRPSRATGVAPSALGLEEARAGGALPPTAHDYGFLRPGQVSREALVAVEGNQYSVPVQHVGAPVTVRLHQERVVLWRDAVPLAEHQRAPDGAHQRVVIPDHFEALFALKPRAQVMLYRQALLDLGAVAYRYIGELSRRQRDRLRAEILAVYALLQQHGAADLVAAMELALSVNAFGADYLRALLSQPQPVSRDASVPSRLLVADLPTQTEIDRQLALYERYVHVEAIPAAPDATRLEVPA